ncbi:MAG: hypothetical protein ABJA37_14240 [Ferruginibacter sp.]
MKKSQVIVWAVCLILFQGKNFAQIASRDSIKLDLSKIYAFALDGNIKDALKVIDIDSGFLSEKDRKLKFNLEQRFKFSTDQSAYPAVASPVDDLIKLYTAYWRMSVLDPGSNYDEKLGRSLIGYLISHYPPAKVITTTTNRDTIGEYLDRFLKEYLETFQLHTTGFGKTGRLLDLLIWKTQKDTVYSFQLHQEKISAPVTMMDDFITLGWEEYATVDRHYPGGWTTKESLFCVKKAYDLSSEDFLISYLAHEGRHFADYKLFPKLKSADLEYRAKLTELSLEKKTLYETVNFFIDNANYNSDNGHSVANYCVIRDLSRSIFKTEFEKGKGKWSKIDSKKINRVAYKILQSNTKALKLKGNDVENYIKL